MMDLGRTRPFGSAHRLFRQLACRQSGPPLLHMEADVVLDDDVGRPADQQQVLDVVAAHQHQPAVAVDGGGIHHRQPGLAVAPAGHEGAEGQAADDAHDEQQQGETDQRRQCPEQGRSHSPDPP